MSKSAIDAEFSNQIFRTDWSAIIAVRRDLAQISPVRLKYDADGYLAGQVLARKTSDGLFYKFSAVSGSSYDSACVLLDNVIAANEDQTSMTGAALARAAMAGYVYKDRLYDYVAGTAPAGSREITDATAITVVKF